MVKFQRSKNLHRKKEKRNNKMQSKIGKALLGALILTESILPFSANAKENPKPPVEEKIKVNKEVVFENKLLKAKTESDLKDLEHFLQEELEVKPKYLIWVLQEIDSSLEIRNRKKRRQALRFLLLKLKFLLKNGKKGLVNQKAEAPPYTPMEWAIKELKLHRRYYPAVRLLKKYGGKLKKRKKYKRRHYKKQKTQNINNLEEIPLVPLVPVPRGDKH